MGVPISYLCRFLKYKIIRIHFQPDSSHRRLEGFYHTKFQRRGAIAEKGSPAKSKKSVIRKGIRFFFITWP
jgi:pyrrolidone-carboxylate peptidase